MIEHHSISSNVVFFEKLNPLFFEKKILLEHPQGQNFS